MALVGPEIEENLSLRYLASSLEALGFRTEILPFNGPGDFVPVLEALTTPETPPLVIGISPAFQWRAMNFIGLAVALRKRGYTGHITAGGHFGALTWQEILTDFPELDSICRHEAEETLVQLARAVRAGELAESLPGLAIRGRSGEVFLTPKRKPPELSSLPLW
jgi:anaerobic magnesium-protoporphyrin IX monomethyl ester cyclase